MPQPAAPFRSPRKTLRRVYVIDKIADVVISGGGLLVVAAVLGIFVYLIAVTARLFEPGSVTGTLRATLDPGVVPSEQLFFQPDEHRLTALMLDRSGLLRLVDLSTGKVVDQRVVIPEGRTITAFSMAPRDGLTGIGYDDGSVALGTLRTSSRFLLGKEDEAALADLKPGDARAYQTGVVQRTPPGQLRLTEIDAALSPPAMIETGDGAVIRLSYQARSNAEYLFALRADGSGVVNLVEKVTPLGGGPARLRLESHPLVLSRPEGRDQIPRDVFITGDGASVLLLWPDGLCQRYDTSSPQRGALVETARLLDEGRRVTAAALMLGSKTLLLGDDAGNVYGCFVARDAATTNRDKSTLVRAHAFAPEAEGSAGGAGRAVAAVGASVRDRSFVSADEAGVVTMRNMTSGKTVTRLACPDGPPALVAIAPKGDAVAALGRGGALSLWNIESGHPDASARSLFGKVWYEGEPAPAHIYQSSSGDDAAESKMGLMPLIWGTVKATLYTMLFAVPMAILAALFTSEFLSPRVKAVIKPTIETMASLPSVVMGFIAAIVLAPAISGALPGVLLAFILTPLAALVAAHLWLFVPVRAAAATPPWARLGMIAVVVTVAGVGSVLLGPSVERTLFAPSERDVVAIVGKVESVPEAERPAWVGSRTEFTPAQERALRAQGLYLRDGSLVRPVGALTDAGVREALEARGLATPSIRAWLNGVYGTAFPGWLALAFPLGVVAASVVVTRTLGVRSVGAGMAGAAREGAMLLVKLALACGAAAAAAAGLTALGFDPRDSVFGPFDQRNTMVVALAMSVAVIPIVYTICEDAMASVPESLRSASLAAGASRWQTAVRVILPVAGSGIFAASMIGLGRAAGETMIVLMATGNTPVMSGSLFDGLRTLSANIAVEMPEAAKDSTHYRVLFLCGLVLLALTFVVNTAAELVRQRFRKRSAVL